MTTPDRGGPLPTITTPELLHVQLRDMLSVVAEILDRHSVRFFLGCGTALGAVRGGDLIPWDFDVDLLVPLDGYAEVVKVLREELPSRYLVKDPSDDPTYELPFSRVHLASAHHKYAHVDLFPLAGTFSHRRAQRAHLIACTGLSQLLYVRTKLRTSRSSFGRPWFVSASARTLAGVVPRRALLWVIDRTFSLRSYAGSPYVTNAIAWYLEREAMPRRLYDGEARATLAGRSYPVPSPPGEYLERLFGDYLTPPPEDERTRLRAFFDSWYLPGLQDAPLEVES